VIADMLAPSGIPHGVQGLQYQEEHYAASFKLCICAGIVDSKFRSVRATVIP